MTKMLEKISNYLLLQSCSPQLHFPATRDAWHGQQNQLLFQFDPGPRRWNTIVDHKHHIIARGRNVFGWWRIHRHIVHPIWNLLYTSTVQHQQPLIHRKGVRCKWWCNQGYVKPSTRIQMLQIKLHRQLLAVGYHIHISWGPLNGRNWRPYIIKLWVQVMRGKGFQARISWTRLGAPRFRGCPLLTVLS